MCCSIVYNLMSLIEMEGKINSLALFFYSSASFINSSVFFVKFILMNNTSYNYQKYFLYM